MKAWLKTSDYVLKYAQNWWSSQKVLLKSIKNAFMLPLIWSYEYRKTSNISRTLVGNKIVDNSDVVGASPVNGLSENNCKRIQETFKLWELVRLILEVLRYFKWYGITATWHDPIMVLMPHHFHARCHKRSATRLFVQQKVQGNNPKTPKFRLMATCKETSSISLKGPIMLTEFPC